MKTTTSNSESDKIVVVGAGGHAKVVIDILEAQGIYEIIGVSDAKPSEGRKYLGYDILGGDEVLPGLLKEGVTNLAMGVGGFKDNCLRKKLFTHFKTLGFQFPPIIHPSAIVAQSCSIGEASVIFPGVVLNTEVEIGANTIIATGSSIDHESIIADHILVSAGVTIGAKVNVGSESLLALGSKIVSEVNIAQNTLVGAGAVVTQSLNEKGTYIGCPAKLRTVVTQADNNLAIS